LNDFDTIYKENYIKMLCFARKMVNDEDVASDIVQEVFIYYYQKSNNGHLIYNLKSWLLRATINKCIDYSNRQKRSLKLDAINLPMVEEDLIEKNQDKIVVNQALSRLKPKEKTLAILYSEGFSYKEISQITGIKYFSVGKMISRVLEKLNKILKDLNYEMY